MMQEPSLAAFVQEKRLNAERRSPIFRIPLRQVFYLSSCQSHRGG
jgi:hypothetical protein